MAIRLAKDLFPERDVWLEGIRVIYRGLDEDGIPIEDWEIPKINGLMRMLDENPKCDSAIWNGNGWMIRKEYLQ